jgi:glycosyltransferase involved in cell wall biosynthesis
VLIVDHRVPMWDRDSGSLRMCAMIRSLVDLGCRVTFHPDDRWFVLPYTAELQALGVEVWYGDVDPLQELKTIGPGLSLVITCRPHTTSRWLDAIRESAPSARIVYDTIDLHWLREARRAGAADGSGQVTLNPKAVALREIELALIRATDETLVVTAEERDQVQADVPGALVRVVPNINQVRAHVPPAGKRRGVLFIGGFEHPPNIDAAIRLVQGVMPRVWKELGDVPVTLIGSLAPPEVQAMASSLVDVAGWVPDVDPMFDRAAAMVAPLNYGAGLKGKVTQALAAGLPVVTTPVGAEGLDAVDGEQLLIGTDDGELAERVIKVLTDQDLWARLSAAGQRLAAERFSPELMTTALSELLGERTAEPSSGAV